MRLIEVKKLLEQKGLDAFLFSSQANVFYLSSFRSTNAYVVLTGKSQHLLTDGRYYQRAKEVLLDWDVRLIGQGTFKYLKAFLREMGAKKVGYEKDRVSCEFKEKLRTKGVRWVGFSGFLKGIRVIKNHDEIRLMKEGVEKSDLIYKRLLDFIKPGITELEVRGFITAEIFKEGGLGESFPAIVAYGEGSAVPHWETSQRSIEHGKNLLIDMGLLWKGYCTDFTRTIFVGKASDGFKRVYQVVKDAYYFALEKVKVGNAIGDVDKV
ncbi:MAG: M24 family metallopeptidase, partial [Aquificaceae bacterium]